MVRDGKLPEESPSTEESHGSATEPTSDASHASEESTHAPSTDSSSTESHGSATAETPSNEGAQHHAKRAIMMISEEYVHQNPENYYNPMEMSRLLDEQERSSTSHSPTTTENWTVWCKYLATSIAMGAMQMIAHTDNNTVSSGHHHLTRRAAPAEDGSMTVDEISFVYKTFLIFAGLILVINSMIKALNTKISGMLYIIVL